LWSRRPRVRVPSLTLNICLQTATSRGDTPRSGLFLAVHHGPTSFRGAGLAIERAQLARCRRLAEWLEREDRLARSWTVETATDMLFALLSTDMIERLLARRWSRRRLGDRIGLLLRSTFLREPEPAP
jgi:hypothetical protein